MEIARNARNKPQSSKILEFFTNSSLLIEKKINEDCAKFNKKIIKKTSKKNVFLLFFKNSFELIFDKTSNDLEKFKRKIDPKKDHTHKEITVITTNVLFKKCITNFNEFYRIKDKLP